MLKVRLPGQINEPGAKPRFKCFLCDRETDIFEQEAYDSRWSVCHRCMIFVVKAACKFKEALDDSPNRGGRPEARVIQS